MQEFLTMGLLDLLAIIDNPFVRTVERRPIMKEKIQLNTRVRKEYKGAARFVAGVIGKSLDQASEIFIRVYVGEADSETEKQREKVRRAWKAAGEKLPFDAPGVAPLGQVA